jgi:hypothetical protein
VLSCCIRDVRPKKESSSNQVAGPRLNQNTKDTSARDRRPAPGLSLPPGPRFHLFAGCRHPPPLAACHFFTNHMPRIVTSVPDKNHVWSSLTSFVDLLRRKLQTCHIQTSFSFGRTRALQAAARRGQPYLVKTLSQGWGKPSTSQLCYSLKILLFHHPSSYHSARALCQMLPTANMHLAGRTACTIPCNPKKHQVPDPTSTLFALFSISS